MEGRQNTLRAMKICRFCLSEDKPLTNIYERPAKETKQTPLPLQLMACVAIEVFENDGMPQLICNSCRSQAQKSYTFKANCKKADDALKYYLMSGNLIKPIFPEENISSPNKVQPTPKRPPPKTTGQQEKKMKVEEDEVITINFTNLGENNQSIEAQKDDSIVSNDSQMEQTAQEVHLEDDQEHHEEEITFSLEDPEVEDEQASVINPTLKVNQVQTDCYPCPHCERSFPLKQLLDLHVANHSRERNYACDECDKSFFTKYDLNKHVLIHSGMKPYNCVVCNKTFSRESLLHRHEKIHVDVPKYLCSQCDRTFLTGEDLDAHTVKHKKKRPFVCKLCNKSFVFKQGLERHEMTSHINYKPHKCNYCEASFTSAIKLTRHVTSHAGLRPYPCKICGRTFLLSHHLTRHMRSHYAAQQPGDAPIGQHKCDICSMSFRRKDSLINHSAIHSMVNLKCVICNTEFDNVDKVKEHITTHLTDLPFPCDKCDYSFETQEQLEDHEMKHAEMEYEEQIEQEVLAEAKKGTDSKDEDDEYEEEYDDDIAEFTITNDMNNPEIVRRSKRSSKIKNYAEFLNNELGSDFEASQDGSQEQVMEEEADSEEGIQHVELTDTQDIEFKPIVRSEGTKVYTRRSLPKVSPKIEPDSEPISKLTQIPSTPAIEQLKAAELRQLPEKEIFNMKVGDKTLTVQKLLLTKDQLKAMAKEGKIEKKGNTYLLKKTPSQSLQSLNVETIWNKLDFGKTSIKKTYERKTTEETGDNLNESVQMIDDNMKTADESVSSI